jgi:hypothetical protein
VATLTVTTRDTATIHGGAATAPVTPELLAEARRALGRQLADRREAAGLPQAASPG